MDTFRGTFDSAQPSDDDFGWDASEDDVDGGYPPEAIGQDERRMQVRAYNHWAGLLGDALFPSIDGFEPAELTEFASSSVLLDFSEGIDNPYIQYLGPDLGRECGAYGEIERLSDVPARSLLSRITDHYMQILSNQAPIGFEAEFVNVNGEPIMYRGILLPFSSDNECIDFIYGVINWKEIADQVTADELLLEIDQALDTDESEEAGAEAEAEPVAADVPLVLEEAQVHTPELVDAWGDEPSMGDSSGSDFDYTAGLSENEDEETEDVDGIVNPLAMTGSAGSEDRNSSMSTFADYSLDDEEFDEDDEEEEDFSSYSFASLSDHIEAPTKKAIDLSSGEDDAEDQGDDYSNDYQATGDFNADGFESGEDDSDEPYGALSEAVPSFAPEPQKPEYSPLADESSLADQPATYDGEAAYELEHVHEENGAESQDPFEVQEAQTTDVEEEPTGDADTDLPSTDGNTRFGALSGSSSYDRGPLGDGDASADEYSADESAASPELQNEDRAVGAFNALRNALSEADGSDAEDTENAESAGHNAFEPTPDVSQVEAQDDETAEPTTPVAPAETVDAVEPIAETTDEFDDEAADETADDAEAENDSIYEAVDSDDYDDTDDHYAQDEDAYAPLVNNFAKDPASSKAVVPTLQDYDPVDDELDAEAESAEDDFDAVVEPAPAEEPQHEETGDLYDCLVAARELARSAIVSEDRTRQTLYEAVGRAYDVSIAAQDEPEKFDQLVSQHGLTVQERAPMTPVVKLVFGPNYDKTRVTEYATVLSHAHRVGVGRGALASFLRRAEGGLKGIVQIERQLRREESGEDEEDASTAQEKLAAKLRELDALMFDTLEAEGPEFALVMIRRNKDGRVELLGEVDEDAPLIERAARKLIG